MKKLFLILSAVTLSYITSAQIQIRGKVLSISKKQISDTGNITISTQYPMYTSFILSDKMFLVDNTVRGFRYRLFDKDTATINNEMVVSYMATIGNDTKLVAASEINGCRDCIKIAVFDFTGNTYFIEYLVHIGGRKAK